MPVVGPQSREKECLITLFGDDAGPLDTSPLSLRAAADVIHGFSDFLCLLAGHE